MKIYEYNDCNVAENQEEKICILQKDFNFYKIPIEKKEIYLEESELVSESTIKDNIFLFIILMLIILITIIVYFNTETYRIVDKYFLIAIIFLLINIPLHELGHIIFLKLFYKKSKIKIGFKFVFIYPAFYVDTSYSYLLPKYKRSCVFLAGNFMNCIFVLFIMIYFPEYLKYCYITVSNILVNFIPIVKSDGYYTFMTLMNKYNHHTSKKKEYVEDFIRGLIMFLFMFLLSSVL